ncbi:MAG: hypothetical protein JSW03_03880 [Candidatus Eiseniibacteriota bacterium]|nr:MAG: hypothetical protein JSW03_03880 [Candidatus Eisenbacteria bacterium]
MLAKLVKSLCFVVAVVLVASLVVGCAVNLPCDVAEDQVEKARGATASAEKEMKQATMKVAELEAKLKEKQAAVAELEAQKAELEKALAE